MKKILTVLLATLAIALIGGVAKVSAEDNSHRPYFNYYKNVTNVGDESDFVRVSQVGANSYSNNVEACTDGQEVTVRVYIHNGASQDFNGPNLDGTSVTVNEKLAISVAKSTNPGTITGTITADNAVNSGISDSATVTCNGQVMDLTYVPGSAAIKNTVQNYVGLSDDVFKGGTPIGYAGQDGKQPACWDYVTYVFAKVKVTKKPVVIPSDAICTLDGGKFIVIDDKKRTVKGGIKPQLTNAVVTGYKIDWGDGTTPSTNQNDTHSYKEDGEYTIQASYTVKAINGGKFSDDSTEKLVSGANCASKVKFETGKPPIVTPPTVVPPTVTHLTKTGPASTLAIFSVVSILGAFLHRAYMTRKAAIQE